MSAGNHPAKFLISDTALHFASDETTRRGPYFPHRDPSQNRASFHHKRPVLTPGHCRFKHGIMPAKFACKDIRLSVSIMASFPKTNIRPQHLHNLPKTPRVRRRKDSPQPRSSIVNRQASPCGEIQHKPVCMQRSRTMCNCIDWRFNNVNRP